MGRKTNAKKPILLWSHFMLTILMSWTTNWAYLPNEDLPSCQHHSSAVIAVVMHTISLPNLLLGQIMKGLQDSLWHYINLVNLNLQQDPCMLKAPGCQLKITEDVYHKILQSFEGARLIFIFSNHFEIWQTAVLFKHLPECEIQYFFII